MVDFNYYSWVVLIAQPGMPVVVAYNSVVGLVNNLM
jgi:hypothetical protein